MDKFIPLFNLLNEFNLFSCRFRKDDDPNNSDYYFFTISPRQTLFRDDHYKKLRAYKISCSMDNNKITFSAGKKEEQTLIEIFTDILKDLIKDSMFKDNKLIEQLVDRAEGETNAGPYKHLLMAFIADMEAEAEKKKLAEAEKLLANTEIEVKEIIEAENECRDDLPKNGAFTIEAVPSLATPNLLPIFMSEPVTPLVYEANVFDLPSNIVDANEEENELVEELPEQTPLPPISLTPWSREQALKPQNIIDEEKLTKDLQARLESIYKEQEKCFKPAEVNHALDVGNALRNGGQQLLNWCNFKFGHAEAAINVVDEFKAHAKIFGLGGLYDRNQLAGIEASITKRLSWIQQEHLKDRHTEEITLLLSAQKTAQSIRILLNKRMPILQEEPDELWSPTLQGYHS